MANRNRTSISFPDALTRRIFALRNNGRFTRCSDSELVRQLAEYGLQLSEGQAIDDVQAKAPAS